MASSNQSHIKLCLELKRKIFDLEKVSGVWLEEL